MNNVGVVGLGYVGLPLALAFARAGLRVIGVDTDTEKVAALSKGNSPIEDVPSAELRKSLLDGEMNFTVDYTDLREAESVILCLPTPLNRYREPDLSLVVVGAEQTAVNLRDGALVVLESTTYPGTTREVLLPILERDGRRVGEDFFLAYSPERVDPGNHKYTISSTPKIVGGITPECRARAEALYSYIVSEVHTVSSPESAELSKLLENIFRAVNIALVNDLAILCEKMGIDVWEVIDAAKTKPFGFMPFYPGPGMGGHCIPIDPFYLSWRARTFDTNAEFIELAGKVNVNMPYYATGRIAAALNADKKPINGSRILILGVSYKPNIGDLRESPSIKILELLRNEGAHVVYHDPHVPELPDYALTSVDLNKAELGKADCVVIATDHSALDIELVVSCSSRIFDLRNAVRRRLGGLLPSNVEVL